MHFTLGSAHN